MTYPHLNVSDALRTNDDLGTPKWIIDLVLAVDGPIALDPCSNPWSLVPAMTSWSAHRGEDGLAQEWGPVANIDGSIFVNPPYSRPMPWARRAVEAGQSGATVFVLVKNDPSTRWSVLLREHSNAWCHFDRRVSFEGGAHKTGLFASTMFYRGGNPYLFAHHFCGLGEVGVRR